MRAILRQGGRFAILGSLCLALPVLATAQSTGTLRGTIINMKGDPLAGAVVEVSNTREGSIRRGTVTDAAGLFNIPSLPPGGSYEVSAAFPDYATVVMPDVEISAARVTHLNMTMVPASDLSERVEVRAQPHVVELESTTTETRFSSEFIDLMPIRGRNYQDILKLAPGVRNVSTILRH